MNMGTYWYLCCEPSDESNADTLKGLIYRWDDVYYEIWYFYSKFFYGISRVLKT